MRLETNDDVASRVALTFEPQGTLRWITTARACGPSTSTFRSGKKENDGQLRAESLKRVAIARCRSSCHLMGKSRWDLVAFAPRSKDDDTRRDIIMNRLRVPVGGSGPYFQGPSERVREATADAEATGFRGRRSCVLQRPEKTFK
jgi:hypothetical protein